MTWTARILAIATALLSPLVPYSAGRYASGRRTDPQKPVRFSAARTRRNPVVLVGELKSMRWSMAVRILERQHKGPHLNSNDCLSYTRGSRFGHLFPVCWAAHTPSAGSPTTVKCCSAPLFDDGWARLLADGEQGDRLVFRHGNFRNGVWDCTRRIAKCRIILGNSSWYRLRARIFPVRGRRR